MTKTETTKHEPFITYTAKRVPIPACWCGWRGDPTFDKGEATRKAYGHVLFHARGAVAVSDS
jgi:hypothetical protein